MEEIKVIRNVLQKNVDQANINRETLQKHGVAAVNIMGSPGSGKTTFIQTLVEEYGEKLRFGVIEGDYEGTRDTETLLKLGIPVVQVNTRACHLTAGFVSEAINDLPLERLDLVMIENVGNLICTAAYDLGESAKVVLLSVPEGDDKPLKYPKMFSVADLVVITKSDISAHFDFSHEALKERTAKLNPKTPVMTFSSKEPESAEPIFKFLASIKMRRQQNR